ncbi:glutamate--cysteine ligase [Nocardioides marinquilinus]
MTAPRTVGVEEELVVVDPADGRAVPLGDRVIRGVEATAGRPEAEAELVRHMVEVQTGVCEDAGALREQVRAARATVGEAAEQQGLAVVASGTAPLEPETTRLSDDDRYRRMSEAYGDLAREGGTCALHVHVGIGSPEEGVAVLDRMAPWLPLLVAMSANSPFADGHDTGYASWRLQVWGRMPTAGPTDPFRDVEGYRQATDALLASGAALDRGMLYFDARLAERYPTVEVRVADVPTDPDDTVLVAVLVRALVERCARDAADDVPAPAWRTELLRAARWRASRWGLSADLLHPATQRPVPASTALEALADHVAAPLADTGDADLVGTGLARVLAGTGASRQRAAFERTGTVEGVVADLVTRTRGSWATA